VEAIGGSVLGHIKTSPGTGTVPVYQSTRYVNSGGSAIAWGLSLTADGPLAGYLSTTAPDSQSALAPFIQSNGLLLQGLAGTASAYLWSVQTGTINHTDHYYLTTGQPPSGYTSEGTTAYIDGVSSSGTVALSRYSNATTGHHYYSTVNDPPSGFSGGTTIGHLHGTAGSGLIELYRHHNSATGDYVITTSSTPPGGYVMQALLGYAHSSGVTSTQQNLSYTYDEVGNVKTITDAVWTGSRSFEYDDLNRLKQATGTFSLNQALVTHNYTYDPIGNILTKAGISYCYGYMPACADVDRPSGVKSTSDGATYSYDGNGNITIGGGREYRWNADNRLDEVVTGPGGSAVMTYDYTGIRIKKSGSSGTTYFPFTGYEVQGGTVTKFIRIGNEIIASKQGTTTKRFYHNDHLGGVNIISDISGAQLQLTEYDPWGKVSRSDGIADSTHRFTGQELDSEGDIHSYGGRYYDQGLGRFISPDPFVQDAGGPQNLNRYVYVLNAPQTYIDPSGFSPESDCILLCGGFFERGPLYLDPGSFRSSSSPSLDLNRLISGYSQVQSNQASNGYANFFGFGSAETLDRATQPFDIPRIPGGGLLRGEFFISSPTIFFLGQGDARGFDPRPNPDASRAFFTLDLESGNGFFQANPSCLRGGRFCAPPTKFGGGNPLKIDRAGRLLKMTGSLGNSVTKNPKIDFDILF
jgi:RHS repeat-associated protein